MARTPRSIPDYDTIFDPVRRASEEKSGKPLGDPVKAARAMLAVIASDHPPAPSEACASYFAGGNGGCPASAPIRRDTKATARAMQNTAMVAGGAAGSEKIGDLGRRLDPIEHGHAVIGELVDAEGILLDQGIKFVARDLARDEEDAAVTRLLRSGGDEDPSLVPKSVITDTECSS